MTPSKNWEQWEGFGYATRKIAPVVYYYPGKIDIEDDENIETLITEVFRDGVAPTKTIARYLLEEAIVVHGQVVDYDGELHCIAGLHASEDNGSGITREATWVEIDEYQD
jgi:hypothetical protein